MLKAVGIGITTRLDKLETHADVPDPVEVTTDALGSVSA